MLVTSARNARWTILATCLASALVATFPAGSSATCYSSTELSQTFPDVAGDGESGLAPEILGVLAITDKTCGIGLGVALQGQSEIGALIYNESVGVYVNTDGNAATGSPTWDGADRVVITIGQSGTDSPPGLGVWNGSTFEFLRRRRESDAGNRGGVSSRQWTPWVSRRRRASGSERSRCIRACTTTTPDFAPEVSGSPFGFGVAFSTSAPPPVTPAPTSPSNPPNPSNPGGGGSDDTFEYTSCRVPTVRKGSTLAAAKRRLDDQGCYWTVRRVRSNVRKGRSACPCQSGLARALRGRSCGQSLAGPRTRFRGADPWVDRPRARVQRSQRVAHHTLTGRCRGVALARGNRAPSRRP